MCGIAGLVAGTATLDVEAEAVRLLRPLAHRGPDGSGIWLSGSRRVALVHTRLSIIELSALGHQPMVSASGRYVITFNGEIYNFVELRRELTKLGHTFRGGSDTEVALAAIEQWSPLGAARRFAGMFAIGIWDSAEEKLHLLRDRLGKKPLCYFANGKLLAFASLVTSLERLSALSLEISRQSVAGMLTLGYVPGESAIYEGVRKVPPGCLVTLSVDGRSSTERYWSPPRAIDSGNVKSSSRATTLEAVHDLLQMVVADRLVADVPIGLFLSGGIDSTVIAALMQSSATSTVQTFTAGFSDATYDEAPAAAAIAAHLGTRHETLYVSDREVLETATSIQEKFDEPFADPSAVPQYLLAQAARTHVTVALTGDGGDEVFGGYNRHTFARQWWPTLARIPRGIRCAIGHVAMSASADRVDRTRRTLGGKFWPSMVGLKAQKFGTVVGEQTLAGAYLAFLTNWAGASAAVGVSPGVNIGIQGPDSVTDVRSMMLADLRGYLVSDVLVKVDRATMSASLEARSPLLDYRVVEHMATVPTDALFLGGKSKAILRAIAARYVPAALLDRPKAGFAPPLENWLRGPLRDWAEDLLSEANLKNVGLVDPAPVRALWRDHLGYRAQRHYSLWGILCLHAWMRARPAVRTS